MAFISWQACLFTTWALSQDSYVWPHSLSPWNITFSFMFPPNSLWELNYLDWYGRVEWKWHFISGDHIWILTSPYNNSIRLSNLWTSLILTFLTEKKTVEVILFCEHCIWFEDIEIWCYDSKQFANQCFLWCCFQYCLLTTKIFR